jgi:hypothetical protein
MNSGVFAVLLIVGIAFFATGIGGWLAHAMMAIGGLGMVVCVFAPGRR